MSNFKLQLHDAIYGLRFYSNSLIHILSLSNSYNNVASLQKNRGDKSHRVIVALSGFRGRNFHVKSFCHIQTPWAVGLINQYGWKFAGKF